MKSHSWVLDGPALIIIDRTVWIFTLTEASAQVQTLRIKMDHRLEDGDTGGHLRAGCI